MYGVSHRLDGATKGLLAMVDEDRPDAVEPAPDRHGESDELGPVVETDKGRCTTLYGKAVERGDDEIGGMFKSFKVLSSSVVSNWKSSAQRAFGVTGHTASTAVPMPGSWRLCFRQGTFRPSSPQRCWMRLSLRFRPFRRACLAARRQPQRGLVLEKSRRTFRARRLRNRRVKALGGPVLADEVWCDRHPPATFRTVSHRADSRVRTLRDASLGGRESSCRAVRTSTRAIMAERGSKRGLELVRRFDRAPNRSAELAMPAKSGSTGSVP